MRRLYDLPKEVEFEMYYSLWLLPAGMPDAIENSKGAEGGAFCFLLGPCAK
ncbi:MAG: hypothetical protein NVS4B4_10700 [Bradyrhizobium sp.]